jgi:hypothetical protein
MGLNPKEPEKAQNTLSARRMSWVKKIGRIFSWIAAGQAAATICKG